MADEDDENENDDGEEGGAKESFFAKKKKLILLVVVGLLLVGLSIGGTIAVLTMFGSSSDPEMADMAEGEAGEGGEEGAEGAEGAEGGGPPALKPAIYYPLKPPILVSFDGRGRQRLLQAEITLLTRDNDVVAAIETHMPMIRNALVLLIGGRTYEEVQTAEGKELLRVECLQELQRLLEQEIGKPGVEQVLFTGLIVQ